MDYEELQRCALEAFGLALTQNQYDSLFRYVGLLHSWSERVRLVSTADRNHLWERHVLDCLAIISHMPEEGCVLDLGSGAGLPGVPIKIMRPDLGVTLLEPARMKALFLQQVVTELGLTDLIPFRARAEALVNDPRHRGHYQAVVARAVGALWELWAWASPLLAPGGKLVAMKGPGEADAFKSVSPLDVEISEALIHLPFLQRDRALVTVTRQAVSRETRQT